MTENPVSVDLDRLRTMANHVEQSAGTLSRLEVAGLDIDALTGSLVGGVAGPARVAAGLQEVATAMQCWAEAARRSASAFQEADRDHAGRM